MTECAHSNVLILKDGVLRTAPCDRLILPGITRMHILQLAAQCGVRVEEKPFTVSELMDADEVLVSSSTALCLKAESIDGHPVRQSAPDTVRRIQNAYRDMFERQTKR